MASDAKDALAVIPWYWRDWRASSARAFLISDPPALMAYRELLDAMWGENGCSLPPDDESLAALSGLPLRVWMKVREKVLRFLTADETGRFTHPRSQHEYRKALAYRDGCRAGGRSTAAKRWGSGSPPIAEQPLGDRTPSPTPSPTHKQNSEVLASPPEPQRRNGSHPKPSGPPWPDHGPKPPDSGGATTARLLAERQQAEEDLAAWKASGIPSRAEWIRTRFTRPPTPGAS